MCSGVNGVSGVESEVNTYFSRQNNWASIPKVVGSTPAVVRHICQLAGVVIDSHRIDSPKIHNTKTR